MSAALFLETLGRASAQAALLVMVVLLVQTLLTRWLRPRWRCALWLLVAARLLLPVSTGSAFSLFNWLPAWPPATAKAAAAPVQPLEAPHTVLPPAVSNPRVGQTPILAATPVAPLVQDPVSMPELDSRAVLPPAVLPEPILTSARDSTTPPPILPAPAPPWHPSFAQIIFALWLAGALGLAIHITIHSLRLARSVARLPRCEDAAALAILRECQTGLDLRHSPELFESPAVPSPVLYGLARPRLILPAGFTQRFCADEVRCVFLHELAHLKRRDIQLNWLFAGLQVIHWFNPLVWVAVFRWRLDRELACDALVLETIGAERRQEYGRTILRLLESVTRPMAAPGLVGILEDKRQLRQRITMISRFRNRPGWGLLSFLLVATLGFICLTDAQVKKEAPAKGAKPKRDRAVATAAPTTPEITLVGTDPIVRENGPIAQPGQTLTVIVVEAGTGSPVPGAEVCNVRFDGGQAEKQRIRRLTDERGRFVLQFLVQSGKTAVRRTPFSFCVDHPDFAPRGASWGWYGGNPEQALPAELTIKLSPGVPVGGQVTGEQGQPLAGVKVLLSGSERPFSFEPGGTREPERAMIERTDPSRPAAVTDANGRWVFPRFPAELDSASVTLLRPNEARVQFPVLSDGLRASEDLFIARMMYLGDGPALSLADFHAQRAVSIFPSGHTIRGFVTDERGRPIAGATVKEGYGYVTRKGAEFTTDRRGRFEALNRSPREWIYTAMAPGRATVSVVAGVWTNSAEARLVLPPARPIQLRVVDDQGLAVTGAEARFIPTSGEACLLDWSGTADTNGVIVWTNAPVNDVDLLVSSAALDIERRVKVKPGEARVVMLSKSTSGDLKVRLRAVDAASGQPVIISAVGVKYGGARSFEPLAKPMASDYALVIKRPGGEFGSHGQISLQVEAEGYAPALPRALYYSEVEADLEVAMTRATRATGVAFQPDGKPAAGARFWIASGKPGEWLIIHAPGQYYGELKETRAGADGRYELPATAGDRFVVVAHESGFRELPLSVLQREGSVTLDRWGRVEGRLNIDPKAPRPERVFLHTFNPPFANSYTLFDAVTPDAEGRFAFTNVPPGELVLDRVYATRMGRPIIGSHPLPIVVGRGESLSINHGGGGQRVIGRVETDPPEAEVNWKADIHQLVLKQPAFREPGFSNYARQEAWQRARDEAFRSPERQRLARAARAYELVFNRDGSFVADDVPPGEYELRIRVNKPPVSEMDQFRRGQEPLGSLFKTVVVQAGTDPMDLGTLTLPLKLPGGIPAAPVKVEARTFQDKPLSLADLRGKIVVLGLWAFWSERSREALKEMERFHAQNPADPRVTFLGLNLDDDPKAAREWLQAQGWTWPQARLEGKERADATAALAADEIPAVFLINPTGRIIGRDLEGDRLKRAYLRALNPNQP